jgi:hypothetical protein
MADLDALYSRTPGPVVFVDESYRLQTCAGELPFYLMAAASVDRGELGTVREALADIAGSLRWHTTDAFREGRAWEIETMGGYLAGHLDSGVFAVEVSFSQSIGGAPKAALRDARRMCLQALARHATSGAGPSASRLLVADHSTDPDVERDDMDLMADLRSRGLVPRETVFVHGHPGDEPLLWAPDLAAWALRRSLALNDSRWIGALGGTMPVVDARSGLIVPETKQSQDCRGTHWDPSFKRQSRGESDVVSNTNLAGPGGGQQGPDDDWALRDLVRRVGRVREQARLGGRLELTTPAQIAARLAERKGPKRGGPPDDPPAAGESVGPVVPPHGPPPRPPGQSAPRPPSP